MQPQSDPFIVPVCHDEIETLYQDDSLLLINKPSKLLSLWGKHPLNKDSVHFRLLKDFPAATLVHRLDFGTSGIMLIALHKNINSILGKQFQARTISKTYTAILWGHVEVDKGLVELPIAKDVDNFPLQKICTESGKNALTSFYVVNRSVKGEVSGRTTRVIFEPKTGRTHQLRIHSSAMGHPILGCDLYATDEAFFMASRLMLHATSLAFDHPITNKRMNIICPCPF